MSYPGYRSADGDTDFGRFFNPEMAPLPEFDELLLHRP